jgi:hypothetical protein
MKFEVPLSWCVVECDGSACGSGSAVGWHTHPVQEDPQRWGILWGAIRKPWEPVAHVRVENGVRTYLPMEGS